MDELVWYIIDEEYLKEIKAIDEEVFYVPNSKKDFNPYIGIAMEINGLSYYIPISSRKTKYMEKGKIDYIKLIGSKREEPTEVDKQYIIENKNELYAVLKVNKMIPVPEKYKDKLNYKKIDVYKNFETKKDKNDYIWLLKKELELINSKKEIIEKRAKMIHATYLAKKNKKLNHICCNYQVLENYIRNNYEIPEDINKNDKDNIV